MHPSAFAFLRAKRSLSNRSAPVALVRALAVIDALLVLALVVVCGLLLALVINRGVAIIAGQQVSLQPNWIKAQLPIAPKPDLEYVVADTGLYPVVANNQSALSPWPHRAGARLLGQAIQRIRPLRGNLGALMTLLALGVLLVLLLTLLGEWRKRLAIELAEEVAHQLRRQIHRQIYRLGHSALPTEGTGPVVNLFSREVNDVRDGVLTDLDRRSRLPVVAAGLLAISLFLSLKLTVFLLSLGGLVWLVARSMDGAARQESDAAARDAAIQLCLLQEDLSMLRTIRVFGGEGVDKERFDEHLDSYREADARRLRTAAASSPASFLLASAAAAVALGLLGYLILAGGRNSISVAAAFLLLVALYGLTRPIIGWLSLGSASRQAGRAAAGLFEYLERRPELQQAVGAQFLAPLKDRITFENVTLEGAGGRILLSGVSAEIPARSRTAIVSLDEPAKLAMVCLIPRLIDPRVGRVRMDGIDLRDITLESLRAQVATVLQADLVFSDSVINNIGLGDPSFGLPRIVEAAKIAHAHHFIQDLPDGYDTVIGPLGHYLKPEEQYRLALARAYLHDPSIVIIEEPQQALDEDVKPLIDDTIDRLAPGRTLIFLPHRLSTIRKCDQVLVLHNGRIDSAGPPRDLHANSKLFRHLKYVEFNQFATGEIEAGQMNA